MLETTQYNIVMRNWEVDRYSLWNMKDNKESSRRLVNTWAYGSVHEAVPFIVCLINKRQRTVENKFQWDLKRKTIAMTMKMDVKREIMEKVLTWPELHRCSLQVHRVIRSPSWYWVWHFLYASQFCPIVSPDESQFLLHCCTNPLGSVKLSKWASHCRERKYHFIQRLTRDNKGLTSCRAFNRPDNSGTKVVVGTYIRVVVAVEVLTKCRTPTAHVASHSLSCPWQNVN